MVEQVKPQLLIAIWFFEYAFDFGELVGTDFLNVSYPLVVSSIKILGVFFNLEETKEIMEDKKCLGYQNHPIARGCNLPSLWCSAIPKNRPKSS